MNDALLTRSQITEALGRLAERLKVRHVVGDIYVFGGAALVMAYDAEPATRDVDAVFRPHGIVHDEAVAIAAELNLPRWWLNDQAAVYLPSTDDAERVGLFDHPNLRVTAASARHLLAMKALAARAYADVEHLRFLLGHLGLSSLAEVEQVCAEVFPDEPLSDLSRLTIEDVLASI